VKEGETRNEVNSGDEGKTVHVYLGAYLFLCEKKAKKEIIRIALIVSSTKVNEGGHPSKMSRPFGLEGDVKMPRRSVK